MAEKYKLTFTSGATMGVLNLLESTDAKSRTALRNHGRIRRAVDSSCTEKKSRAIQFPGGKEQVVEDVVAKEEGSFELTEEQFKYLKDISDKKIEAGVQGGQVKNYLDLWEAIEKSEKDADTPKEDKK